MRELQGVVDYQPGDIDSTVAIEPKLDGGRGHARWVDGIPVLYTRNGIEIPLPHIQRELALLMPQGYFFHGELTHHAGFEAIKSAIAQRSEDIHFHRPAQTSADKRRTSTVSRRASGPCQTTCLVDDLITFPTRSGNGLKPFTGGAI